MKPYSADLCNKMIGQLERGVGPSEVARNLQVHRSTVYRAWWRYQKNGQAAGKRPGGHRRSRLMKHQGDLEKWIRSEPDLTLEEIRERCLQELGIQLHLSSIARFLTRMGFSYKKNASGQRTRSR